MIFLKWKFVQVTHLPQTPEDFPFLFFEQLLVASKESIGGKKDVPMEISEVERIVAVERTSFFG